MYTAVIIDDEFHARENLALLLGEFAPDINVIGQADGVSTGVQALNELRPNILFLDIRMPSGAEGFDLLGLVENKDFLVVFVTAFKDYAIKALNANALHYVLKPIDIDDLLTAVEKIKEYHYSFKTDANNAEYYKESIENLKKEVLNLQVERKITLFHAKGFHIVKEKDIMFLEADNNKTVLHFNDGTKYFDNKTIKVFEDLLSEKFLRIHKSHIINLDFLTAYDNYQGNTVTLEGGLELPISKARLHLLLEKVKG